MDEHSRRARFVPGWLVALIATGILVVVIAGVAILMVMAPEDVVVPDVTGLWEPEARDALQQAGLTLEAGGTRYSTDIVQGRVVGQDPPAGAIVLSGEAVTVIVSAGAETVTVPSLIGVDIASARRDLDGLGLAVSVRTVESTAPVDTVIELSPDPGTAVPAGSVVNITVAGRSVNAGSLVPYPMNDVTVLLDAGLVDADGDPAREVERRLRSLLEASGATVLLTRTPAGAAADQATRARVVVATAATLVVSLNARTSGAAGMEVVLLPRDLASSSSRARRLADAIIEGIGGVAKPAAKISGVDDAVLAAAPCPAVSVVLGNTANAADLERFEDPAWLDAIAQALYRAVGTVFAAKGSN
jgi:serine/threonine-protein kinase